MKNGLVQLAPAGALGRVDRKVAVSDKKIFAIKKKKEGLEAINKLSDGIRADGSGTSMAAGRERPWCKRASATRGRFRVCFLLLSSYIRREAA